MLDHILLLIGFIMIVAGIVLAVMARSPANVIPLLLLGTVCCLIGVPGLQNLGFKVAGQEATITMSDLKTGANDLQAQLAANNQKIQSLSDAIAKQVDLNKDINTRFAQIEQKLQLPSAPLPANVASVSPSTATNNSYVVLVFYKDERAADASTVKQKLVEAGYQASSINSSLAETTIGPQPANSAYIVYTTRGAAIVAILETLIRQTIPAPDNPIGKSGPSNLRRGDAQIYLF